MASDRLKDIPGFSIDSVAAKAGQDPDILRLENLDTDLRPPLSVIKATEKAIKLDDGNTYLPFTGQELLRELIATRINQQAGLNWNAHQVIITNGGTEGMMDVLLALTDPGDEVILTDPTYAGMIYRVKLTGAVPVLVSFVPQNKEWRLDLDRLKDAITSRTKALFIMNPSMPTGAVLSAQEWEFISKLCQKHNLWLFYNAAMERILYDNQPFIHPAGLNGMAKRTVVIGSASKEFRMIGWRMGWIAAPNKTIEALAKAHIYNVVTSSAFAQNALVKAFTEEAELSFQSSVQIWEERRNMVNLQLADYDMISAAGGWSQLLDVSALGISADKASQLLLERGKVAVTPMTHWGKEHSKNYIRLVFSNEPVERLASLKERFQHTFS